MKSVFFGISPSSFDTGTTPACALNAQGTVVEVHRAPLNAGLWYCVGHIQGLDLQWRGHGSLRGDNGYNPSVALTGGGAVIEVHDSGHGTLWYWTGRVNGDRIEWVDHDKYDDGTTPAVAVSSKGTVVEVHASQWDNGLWWTLGQLDDTTVRWTGHGTIEKDAGHRPCVAINNSGWVLEVHDSGHGTLWYWLGKVNGSTIDWLEHAEYDCGLCPSIALTEDNLIFEVHQSPNSLEVRQRFGRIDSASLQWLDPLGSGPSYYFDTGTHPRIACNGQTSVQVHSNEAGIGLFGNASLVFDRASWMECHLAMLGAKSLTQIVLPASHDSGMYLGGGSILGRTQDLPIYGQLMYGIRYFDLRPRAVNGDFEIYHGPISGPKISDVIADVRRFMQEKHRELVVLKISHSANIDDALFNKLCSMLTDPNKGLGPYLFQGPLPAGMRLAELPISTFLRELGCVLVVFDKEHTPAVNSGLYKYRDTYEETAVQGDLTVFDIFSSTMSFDDMARGTKPDGECHSAPQGQIPKFQGPGPGNYRGFDGKCLSQPSVPCDLFLLSWTLTPPTDVWLLSRTANQNLVQNVFSMVQNKFGKKVNLLYTDYVEYSRSADLALCLNGLEMRSI